MKIDRIEKANMAGQKYWLIHAGRHTFVQRTGINSAADDPLTYKEELTCALCERIAELEAAPNDGAEVK